MSKAELKSSETMHDSGFAAIGRMLDFVKMSGKSIVPIEYSLGDMLIGVR